MTATPKITLYYSIICPWAQRANIALTEAGVEFEKVHIDLANKPDWYATKINPESKVPAVTVDGTNIAESYVIVELVNDLFPEKNLLPKDPITRAQIRFFVEFYNSKINSLFNSYIFNPSEETRAKFLKDVDENLKRVNELLLQQSPAGPYFLGEQYSIADIAVSPFIGRLRSFLKHFVVDFDEFETIKQSPRLAEFFNGVTSRPSFKETFVSDDEFVALLTRRGITRF